MVLEVASPPGVGKTSLLVRVAISARVSSQAPEVLLVRHPHPSLSVAPLTSRRR